MSNALDVDPEEFWDTVAEGLVLVDVWSASCQPCLALTPHLERVAAEREDLTLAKLEAPKARRLCMELKVMGLPTLLLYRDGEEVARITDPALDADDVDAWLETHLQ